MPSFADYAYYEDTLDYEAMLEYENDPELLVQVERLKAELELHRAREDAETRAILHVLPLDTDDDFVIVSRRDLKTAHGVARRNREDLELGDDI